MTIDEAYDRGITDICRPEWNALARLILPPICPIFGGRGLIASLVDPASNALATYSLESKVDIIMFPVDGTYSDPTLDCWLPWVKPADYDEWLEKFRSQCGK